MKPFLDLLKESLEVDQSIMESAMPEEDTGMTYKTKRGYTETVKQNGNRFYYYDRFMSRWMPLKKADVIFDKK